MSIFWSSDWITNWLTRVQNFGSKKNQRNVLIIKSLFLNSKPTLLYLALWHTIIYVSALLADSMLSSANRGCQRVTPENWKGKGTGSSLSASCLLADYIRFSPRRIFHLGGGTSFSLGSRWFKCDIFPILGKPALSHASSYRHLHQLVDARPTPHNPASLNVWVPASELLLSNLLSFNNSSYFSLLPQSYRY